MTSTEAKKSNLITCYLHFFSFGSILVSLGILIVTVGGSWDITNHLLNKPETFFSPPHALLYGGVATSLIGVALSFIAWRKMKQHKDKFTISLKTKFVGILLLVGAGPFDFAWHSNFGLDGLLSPPHITLIFGMLLCSIGGMLGIVRYLQISSATFPSRCLLIVAILPMWLAGSGIISSLSLPFSNTDFFKFNPEPLLGLLVATTAYPFLISFSTLLASKLSDFRFGMLSLVGGLFLLVYGMTAIVPNFAILDTIVFYSLNLIPFVISDVLLSLRNSKMFWLVGTLLGSSFYMIYYPYVMYTYNEFFLGKLVSPSMIHFVYFELMENVFLATLVPAIFCGIVGAYVATKISKMVKSTNRY